MRQVLSASPHTHTHTHTEADTHRKPAHCKLKRLCGQCCVCAILLQIVCSILFARDSVLCALQRQFGQLELKENKLANSLFFGLYFSIKFHCCFVCENLFIFLYVTLRYVCWPSLTFSGKYSYICLLVNSPSSPCTLFPSLLPASPCVSLLPLPHTCSTFFVFR